MNWLVQMAAPGPVVTDGAWGTQMQVRGLGLGEFPDAWNLTHPDRVREVARAYVDAGSQIILTNTFGANRLRLAEADLADQMAAINRRGAALSREAAAGRARVAGSIGPTGKLLLMGEVTVEQWTEAFAEQALALAEGGAEALVVETMSDPDEARAAVAAAKRTGLPVVACMVFDAGQQKDRTMMGNTPEQVARILTDAGADVIGSNCGQGVAGFVGLCRRLKSATDRPIWIKANAGLPEMIEAQVVYRTTPEEFAGYVPALRDAGAAFIGGCCGTTPDTISAVCAALAQD